MTNRVVLLVVIVASAGCASTGKIVPPVRGAAAPYDLSYENVEFPPYDQNVWRRQRPGLVITAADAAAQTPSAPERPALLAEAERLDDALESLEALVKRYPDRIDKAFELLMPEFRRFNDQVHHERRDRLQHIVAAARRQAGTLPREDAARAIHRVMFAEAMFFTPGQYDKEQDLQRRAFLEQYRGTEAALNLEVEIMSRRGDILTQIANLRKFAADNPGTTPGARALYQAGFQLAVNVGTSGRIPRGADPTERILQVLDVMKELESGQYPRCEWVEKAPSLIVQFFASRPSYGPHNIDTLLPVYQQLLDRHQAFVNYQDVSFAVGLLSRMAELYTLKGAEDEIDTVFAKLDRRPGQTGVGSYLKARLYIGPMNDQRRSEKQVLLKKVTGALLNVQANGTRIYQRGRSRCSRRCTSPRVISSTRETRTAVTYRDTPSRRGRGSQRSGLGNRSTNSARRRLRLTCIARWR